MLLTKNSKIKNSQNSEFKRIFNFTIPALKTDDGFMTCPNASACAVGCYARERAYSWPKVKAKHHLNFIATQSDGFIDAMSLEVKLNRADLVRIHDAGDFYSTEYLEKWIAIAKQNPGVIFYAYTKMVDMLKKRKLFADFPQNFKVIFSLGGKEDSKINQETDRHSRVFPTLDALLAAGYVDTSHDDTLAIGGNPKIGLVYHGLKKIEKTGWKKYA
jgi:Gene product 88